MTAKGKLAVRNSLFYILVFDEWIQMNGRGEDEYQSEPLFSFPSLVAVHSVRSSGIFLGVFDPQPN